MCFDLEKNIECMREDIQVWDNTCVEQVCHTSNLCLKEIDSPLNFLFVLKVSQLIKYN